MYAVDRSRIHARSGASQAGGGEEGGHLGGVLDAGGRLDAARDVDGPWLDRLDRGGDVVGVEAAGEDEPTVRVAEAGIAREAPVEHLAGAAAAGGGRVEQERVDRVDRVGRPGVEALEI